MSLPVYSFHQDDDSDVLKVKELIKEGKLDPDMVFYFDYCYKGCWKYNKLFKDVIYEICGGEATYEAAYNMELKSMEKLSDLIWLH
jgi:hypothetical protein